MKRIFTLVLATVLITTQYIFAVPAYPNPINYTLPDGSQLTIQLRGDERINWAETLDGFTLLRNSDGFFEYATLNEIGDLVPSGIRVNDMPKRTSSEQNFVHSLQRRLMFSEYQIEAKFQLRRTVYDVLRRSATENPQQISGSVRIPVILVGFSNRPFTRTVEDFYMLFNQLDYTLHGAAGSVRDYFLDVSYGAFDLQADIFGPFNLPNTSAFYASGSNARLMARQAVDSAYLNGGIDFSIYHYHYEIVNGIPTRTLSAVHLIFAGHCAAVTGSVNDIWSEQWALDVARTYNGTRIFWYSSSSEFRGATGTNLATIGTIVHELGHSLLDWPDTYSVIGFVPTNCVDLATWCVMAAGSWNGPVVGGRRDGSVPARPSAWLLVNAGWVPEITLSTPQDVTIPNPLQTGRVYRINTTTSGEYFLLENRQRIGWDAFIPSSGMIIYHVDRTPGALADWDENAVTGRCNQRRLYIKQAGCALTNGCQGGGWNRANDVWPRGGFTEFTDNSIPSSLSWVGENTNKPVTEITHNEIARTISFAFMGGELPPPIYSITLSQTETHIFDTVIFGCDEYELTPLNVIITNTGNQPTGMLDIALSGTNADNFTLSRRANVPSIEVDSTYNFTVLPNRFLDVGSYVASITVSGENDISEKFDVSFTVKDTTTPPPLPVYSITLSQTETHIFDTVIFGYDEYKLTPLEVTITNTGNQPTGMLTIELIVPIPNAEDFIFSRTSISNIAVDSTDNFTVVPRTGLAVGTHQGEILVHSDNEIHESFSVSLTVNQATSISYFEKSAIFNVFPNPVTDGKLIVEISDNIRSTAIQIYDLLGNLVLTRPINRPRTELDISHLPNGAYVVRIGQKTVRIIKQ
ncbi:MAG: M6 family metalloprotease domain-containing protein [Bacteroidales bacterium]|nr:M6 family metalloprotease domain-containing protein [Bacteroidales bacterium]